jgi:hypothetical protein
MGFLLTGVRAIVCDTSMVRLRDDVKQLLAHVEATDAGEDAQYEVGYGRRIACVRVNIMSLKTSHRPPTRARRDRSPGG